MFSDMQYKDIEPVMFVSGNALISGLDLGGLRIHNKLFQVLLIVEMTQSP